MSNFPHSPEILALLAVEPDPDRVAKAAADLAVLRASGLTDAAIEILKPFLIEIAGEQP